jgi:hypothetical protein
MIILDAGAIGPNSDISFNFRQSLGPLACSLLRVSVQSNERDTAEYRVELGYSAFGNTIFLSPKATRESSFGGSHSKPGAI